MTNEENYSNNQNRNDPSSRRMKGKNLGLIVGFGTVLLIGQGLRYLGNEFFKQYAEPYLKQETEVTTYESR